MRRSHSSAFSLVELSIVLVILGLLVGGVLSGRALIRAAELRNVTVEYQTWITAINTFKQKYNALPGDMPNATSFWGRADDGTFSGQCATPNSDRGTGKQTCNGNGDGTSHGNENNERYRFWQHLSNAGLIEGTYAGRSGNESGAGGGGHHAARINCPASRIDAAGWSFTNSSSATLPTTDSSRYWYIPGSLSASLLIGGYVAGQPMIAPVLTAEEAWNIDNKMDDGKPGTGSVHATNWGSCTTATTSTGHLTAEYALSGTGATCGLNFRNSF